METGRRALVGLIALTAMVTTGCRAIPQLTDSFAPPECREPVDRKALIYNLEKDADGNLTKSHAVFRDFEGTLSSRMGADDKTGGAINTFPDLTAQQAAAQQAFAEQQKALADQQAAAQQALAQQRKQLAEQTAAQQALAAQQKALADQKALAEQAAAARKKAAEALPPELRLPTQPPPAQPGTPDAGSQTPPRQPGVRLPLLPPTSTPDAVVQPPNGATPTPAASLPPSTLPRTAAARIAYPNPVINSLVGQPIPALLPRVSGGQAVQFVAKPALPSGLFLDAKTGAITGKPRKRTAGTQHTIEALDAVGQVMGFTVITVVVRDPRIDGQ